MKNTTKQILKMGKWLMVLSVFFSQLSFPLGVLAEEIAKTDESVENLETNENTTKEEISNNEESQKEEVESNEDTIAPIPPIDGEESDNQEGETNNYHVTINGEEVTEYTISADDSKVISIVQNYEGEEEYTFETIDQDIDFTNKLYGDYKYTFNVISNEEIIASQTITIHYEGDNSEILNQYLKEESKITYQEGTYIVLGSPLTTLTAVSILEQFEQEALQNDYKAELSLKNNKDEVLTDLDTVINQNKLILKNNTFEVEYPIAVVGDINNDGIVNGLDATMLIDNILTNESVNYQNDLNFDQKFNILDATYPVFATGNWENDSTAFDELKPSVENKTEIYIDEEVEVKYYIEGFEKDALRGIEGFLQYDKTILELTNLELTNVTPDEFYGNINDEGKFAYLLDDYQTNGIFMTLTFKALAEGETDIAIEEIIASTGIEANMIIDSITTIVKVLNYGTGGDVDPDEGEDNNDQTETTPEQPVVTPTPTTPEVVVTPPRYVALSSDNHIKSLTIEGYDIEFDSNKYEYTLTVKNNVNSLDLSVILNNENASYYIEGNKDFKVGENIVTITVTAENGQEQTYTLKVNKEKDNKKAEENEDDEEVEAANSSSKTVIIILIILVIIGLIYVIFKDDEEDKKESKK